jgi:GNAT superfamily N-acetyltransferase
MRLRHVNPLDYDKVLAVVDTWWEGRPMSARLSHVFFSHFAPTSFVLEIDGGLIGFLLGFLSQTHPDEAYVHFIGVHPDYRRLGLGRRLYERFFAAAQMNGRRYVRAITSPSNGLSIAFHRSMGFELVHGDVVIDGIPVWCDYAGVGGHRVVFRRDIVATGAPSAAGDTGRGLKGDAGHVLAS